MKAQSLACILLKELQIVIGHAPHKLIAQTYDGAAALSGVRNRVQAIIKDVYCYVATRVSASRCGEQEKDEMSSLKRSLFSENLRRNQ